MAALVAVAVVVAVPMVTVGAIVYTVKRFRDSINNEMTRLNIKDRMESDTYARHKNEIKAAKRKLRLSQRHVNIGFAGHTKTGKSTLLNSLRGIDAQHPNAARTDIEECIIEPQRYDYCNSLPNLKLYDFPGAGTIDCPEPNYFFNNGLCLLDVLIIVLQPTMCISEISLARDALANNVPIIFVRSQMDVHFRNLKDERKIARRDQATANEVLNERKEAHRCYLEQHAPDLLAIPFFVISSRTIEKISYWFVNGFAIIKDGIVNLINNGSVEDAGFMRESRRIIFFEEQKLLEKLISINEGRTRPIMDTNASSSEDISHEENATEQEHISLNNEDISDSEDDLDSNLIDQDILSEGVELVENENVANQCAICWLNSREIVFEPCRHLAACRLCADAVQTCPFCRSNIENRLRIYQP